MTFHYQEGYLHAEQVSLQHIASAHGTPTFVYSRSLIEAAFDQLDRAFAIRPHQICYAVKANSNLAILDLLARCGAGFDIVSGGELARVVAAGCDPHRTIFSGVGKQVWEIDQALAAGIGCFNVESRSELDKLAERASAHGTVAPVSIRVNPDVDPGTHPYISTGLKENKFGVNAAEALALYRLAADHPSLDVIGLDCHIGSQIADIQPFEDALLRLLPLVDQLTREHITLKHLDLGGGLGVTYQNEAALDPIAYAQMVDKHLGDRELTIMLEPGRSLVANAGILLTRVITIKENEDRHFAVADAAMNDLIRPALYQSWQDVRPVSMVATAKPQHFDIVGPICETGDFLAKSRELSLTEGDLVAIFSSGAYGFVMSSNYNSRPRAAEILVDGDQAVVIRERESLSDLWRGETTLPPEGE
ncbi:MAG: diaminopimelate decarboxylase [Pseudomonadota bacterium]